MVGRITRVLVDADDDPPRLYRQPAAWVHINAFPEGNWGAAGQVVGLADIAGYVVTGSLPAAPAAVRG
jgi:phenylpyruvate tautomerase PptA (4-oxalocrotonate tautomerase family)